ncbi:MAG: tRNA-binding protein [Salibacteraceae bacterium]
MSEKPLTDYSNFDALDVSVGTIIKAEPFREARKPAYVLFIDFGEHGILKSSAQITDNYKLDELINSQVVAVVNFPDKQVANLMSQCLVLGVLTGEGVVLLRPDKKVENGSKIA